MTAIEDESILTDLESAENLIPSKQKVVGDRIIYSSQSLGWTKSSFGTPVLCDFGAARDGNAENTDDIQPEIYRAPEVVLAMPWSYSVDIWNVGVLVSFLIFVKDISIKHITNRVYRYGICSRINTCSTPWMKKAITKTITILLRWLRTWDCRLSNSWNELRRVGGTLINKVRKST